MKKHISVFGKVQGVFFPGSTHQKAEALGLTGFVQNKQDGSVYLEAEGDRSALEQLVAWLHQGPEHAQVDRVEVKEIDEFQGYKTFMQRR